MRFTAALSALLALTLYLVATGLQVSARITTQSFSQAALVGHMAAGLLVVPLIVLTVWWHPVRSGDVPVVRRWLGRIVGVAALLIGLGASWAGFRLPYEGNVAAHPELAEQHRVVASVYVAVFVGHLVISWSLRHRVATGRRIEALYAGGLVLGACALATAAVAALVPRAPRELAVPAGYKQIGVEPKTLFTPGRQSVTHGKLIPVAAMSGSLSCGASGCHTQITAEWSSSSHRNAARNEHYRAQVRLRIHDVPVKPYAGARFCSACHEPVAVFAGEVDPGGRGIDFSENIEEGISCVTCHRMTGVKDISGNAAYVLAPPQGYTGQGSAGAAGWVARAAIRAKPAAHRDELMRPLLRDPEACAPCHRLTVGPGINPNGFFVVQETFDEWRHTTFATSDDPAKRRRCQDCHMPLVASSDPAARAGKHHSHRFPGSNTIRPFLDRDAEQLAVTQAFLQSGVVKLSLKTDGAPGKVVASITNEGVGHRFPTGTVDMHELWVELVVTDASGKPVYASGLVDPKTHRVDPAAVQYRSEALGKSGEWLYRRDMWNLASFRVYPERSETLTPGQFGYNTLGIRGDFFNLTSRPYMRTVWPGTSEDERWSFTIPAGTRGPLDVRARLRFRKSNQQFTDWVFDRRPLREGSGYAGPHEPGEAMPITDVATAALSVPLESPSR